jgi:phosphoserine phosphatase RsbU/P
MTSWTKTRFLYLLLAFYIATSLTYYVMGMLALNQQFLHTGEHIRTPFLTEDDPLTLSSVTPEAVAAGLAKGDRLVEVNGEPYRGHNQIVEIVGAGGRASAHPNDLLDVVVRKPDGTLHTAQVHTVAGRLPTTGDLLAVAAIEVVPPLVCLLVGYWVVAARPRDWNAWLLLVLLTLTEVYFLPAQWWPDGWLVFLGSWYTVLQVVGGVALLLFGIYFPERWRVDAKYPWLKWFIVVPLLACAPITLWIDHVQNFHADAWGSRAAVLAGWVEDVINPLSLVCVLAYWGAILDKLHSATTADARRRMRVLCAGSVIGLGSLLIAFVLLPHFVTNAQTLRAVRIAGALLILALPFSLAYVVVVQRALDVRILLRMGTRYALARVTLITLELGIALFLVIRFVLPLFEHRGDLTVAVPVTLLVAGVLVKVFVTRNSLSHRLQDWLDRKFFREAYDAEVVLSDLSEQARRFTEAGPLIETISRRIAEVLHVQEVGVFLRGGRAFHLQLAVGIPMDTHLHFDEGSSTIRNLMRSNQPATLYRESPDGWFLLADERERSTLEVLRAELLLPLAGRERLLGLMTLGAKRSEEAYTPSDLRLLQNVGSQAGLALEISDLAHSLARQATERERIEREIEIAREVQERLYPQEIPIIPGLTLAGACRPAQGVGGDYYDVIQLDDGRLGLALGDVSGKGISAALLMASLRASLRGMTMDGPRDLAKLMHKVNRLVYEASATNRYATFFFATYDPATCELRYVNAGHNPPLILRGGSTLWLDGGGPVVGLLTDAAYEEHHLTLKPGDLLLAYTDGISEAMTRTDEEWGEERMVKAVIRKPESHASEILKGLFAAADAFAAGAPQHDDMTLLLMKLDPLGTPASLNGVTAAGAYPVHETQLSS